MNPDLETRIDHPEQVQPGWILPPEQRDPSPRQEALAKYQEAADRLAERDDSVAETKAAWEDARTKQRMLLDEIAGFARVIGSDPLGLLKGRGVAWTGRTRRKPE